MHNAAHDDARDRIAGAVARVVRHHARAAAALADFGPPAAAMVRRVAALADAPPWDRSRHAAAVRELADALSLACQVVELEDGTAADLAVDCHAIAAECGLIVDAAAQDPRCSAVVSRVPCVQERERPVNRGGDEAGVVDVVLPPAA
jgi:hypothetical protein